MTLTSSPKSFLIATWEGGGCVTPALTVARKLLARGHRVRVMSDHCNRPECEASGAVFVPWTTAPSRPNRDRATDPMQDWLAPDPVEALKRCFDGVFTGPALAYARDVIAELRREPADLVITIELLFGVQAGCEAIGQPYVCFAPNVSLFPLPGVPPMGPGLAPAANDEERALHAEIAVQTIALFDHGLPALNAARAELGLAALAHVADQPKASLSVLLATARAFDFAPDVLPPGVQYVGPQLGEPAWAEPVTMGADPRPLVLVSFSTTFQDHAAVVQRVVDALADLPARGIVTLGGSLRPGEIQPAANVQVLGSARHDALMAQAALVVTHGGHGTVARSLAHRRPLLVMPHGRDQADNGARVAARGAGLMLMPTASTQEIRTALERLLSDPAFSHAADRLGRAVAAEAENSPIVEVLEGLAVPAREVCVA
jgi:UDP:flavonoid glycosyltransferase YjiC (YdhE family)